MINMSKFDELMKQPLPSKSRMITESEELDDVALDEDLGEANDSALDTVDEMLDDDIEALADALGIDEDDLGEDDYVDDEDDTDLNPEEEMHADDLMSIAATTVLIDDQLNNDEKEDFVANDASTAVAEGFMTDSDVNQMAYDLGLVQESNYPTPMLIRLDAEAKKKQLYALAVNICAAAKNDPDYVKLKKIMKVRKVLRAKLDKKFHNQAIKRMKVYFMRLKKSKSEALSKIGNKMSGK